MLVKPATSLRKLKIARFGHSVADKATLHLQSARLEPEWMHPCALLAALADYCPNLEHLLLCTT